MKFSFKLFSLSALFFFAKSFVRYFNKMHCELERRRSFNEPRQFFVLSQSFVFSSHLIL